MKKKGSLMALDTFGKRLKVLRVDRGLSQIDLRDRMEKLCEVSIGETYVAELDAAGQRARTTPRKPLRRCVATCSDR
jgi:hypothetical protein